MHLSPTGRRPPTAKRTSRRTGASRSSSRASLSPLAEALAAFTGAAAQLDARWYLFGAQAVAIYGVPRTTDDIDVTIEAPAAATLLRALEREGFRPTIRDMAVVTETRVLPIVHDATGISVDVVLAGPGLEELFLDQARVHAIGRVRVSVIAPEHLIALKLLAGRPKDIEDVRGLLRQPKLALDRDEIDSVLAALEEGLARNDLRPLLEELTREAGRTPRGQPPSSRARSGGSRRRTR